MDQAGADMFNADRRTDMTKLIVAFSSFANTLSSPLSSGREAQL
jgi:hypothetical protein